MVLITGKPMDIAVNTATRPLPIPDTNAPFPKLLLTGLGLGFIADKQANSFEGEVNSSSPM